VYDGPLAPDRSVFNGAADKDAYNQIALLPKERTIKVVRCKAETARIYTPRCARFAAKQVTNGLAGLRETQQAEHPEDWLLSMEIFEILDATDQQPELKAKIGS
jgi:phenylalanine-4-hydroxylase